MVVVGVSQGGCKILILSPIFKEVNWGRIAFFDGRL